MLATMIAYLVSGETRIYESQVETRAQSPAHRGEYVIPLIQLVSVADAMRVNPTALGPGTPIAEAEQYMTSQKRRGFPVVDGERLVGIFTASDAVKAERHSLRTTGEAMTKKLVVAFPGESLHTALSRMSQAGVSRLPVVAPEEQERLLGMIDARDIAEALDKQLVSRRPATLARDRNPDTFI